MLRNAGAVAPALARVLMGRDAETSNEQGDKPLLASIAVGSAEGPSGSRHASTLPVPCLLGEVRGGLSSWSRFGAWNAPLFAGPSFDGVEAGDDLGSIVGALPQRVSSTIADDLCQTP